MIRMFSYFWSNLYMQKCNFNFNYIILINIRINIRILIYL